VSAKRSDTRLERRYVYECALEFIAAHHARPLALRDVASHTLTSTRQLQRVLREEGDSFRRLLLQARMAHAVKLLETQAPIGDIAQAVGYLDAAAFSKAFRGRFGHTPSAFRQRSRSEPPKARRRLSPQSSVRRDARAFSAPVV